MPSSRVGVCGLTGRNGAVRNVSICGWASKGGFGGKAPDGGTAGREFMGGDRSTAPGPAPRRSGQPSRETVPHHHNEFRGGAQADRDA